jgi:K+-sensing histidine kinase KdpD
MHPLVTIKKRIELEVSARQPSQSLVESLGTIGDQTDRMIDVIKARAAGVYLGHNLLPPRELLRAAMADLDPETCAWIAEPLVAPALASARVKTNFWLTTGIASLLENAVDCARDHESKVRVTVDVFSEGTVHLLISNEGPVLSHEDVDRMLEAGHSTKDSAHLGLGVPLAEAGIRSVDGELVLRPRQTGGLDAEIMLPLRRITANPSAGAQ